MAWGSHTLENLSLETAVLKDLWDWELFMRQELDLLDVFTYYVLSIPRLSNMFEMSFSSVYLVIFPLSLENTFTGLLKILFSLTILYD